MLTSGSLTFIITIGILALFFIIERITIAVERIEVAKYKSQSPKCAIKLAQDEGLTVVDMNKEVK